MRWYVSRNGETVGPVEESEVAAWVRGGMVEATVRDDAGGPWTPLEQSPFGAIISGVRAAKATAQAKEDRKNTRVGLAALAGAAVVVSLIGALRGPSADELARRAAEADAKELASARARRLERETALGISQPPTERRCELHTSISGGSVPVFPTEAGLDEWLSAQDDDKAAAVALLANGGFLVEPGTPCHMLDLGFTQSRVRVTAGAMIGRSGFVPTGWTRGK